MNDLFVSRKGKEWNIFDYIAYMENKQEVYEMAIRHSIWLLDNDGRLGSELGDTLQEALEKAEGK